MTGPGPLVLLGLWPVGDLPPPLPSHDVGDVGHADAVMLRQLLHVPTLVVPDPDVRHPHVANPAYGAVRELQFGHQDTPHETWSAAPAGSARRANPHWLRRCRRSSLGASQRSWSTRQASQVGGLGARGWAPASLVHSPTHPPPHPAKQPETGYTQHPTHDPRPQRDRDLHEDHLWCLPADVSLHLR